jgi:hypothetical protein
VSIFQLYGPIKPDYYKPMDIFSDYLNRGRKISATPVAA